MSKIEVKPISWERDSMSPRLEFEVTGINYTIANTLRRVVMTHIPVYAFNNVTIS
jgi:DNA-directed RNA polymerase alpha subunit